MEFLFCEVQESSNLYIEWNTVYIIRAYAPQMSCNQKEKDDFVTALNETLSVILSNERTILVVDVNTYISRYCGEFNKVRRRCGYGQKNGGDTSLQHS